MEANRGQVYCIKNTKNNLVYVGQTVTLRKAGKYVRKFGYEKRFLEHLVQSKQKRASVLGKAIRDLGESSFYVELLEECDIPSLDERERYWIDRLGSLCPNGYNALYGAPYAHDEEAKRKISEGMKAAFQDDDVRKAYSEAHLNKFHEIDSAAVDTIEIHPIKEGGSDKIVYMYVTMKDGTQKRRRYGGIHEKYEDAYSRCHRDALELVDDDAKRIHVRTSRCDDGLRDFAGKIITSIELRPHNMNGKTLVSAYYTFEGEKGSKRYVFGGKKIDLLDAYKSACEFVEKTNVQNVDVKIKNTLQVILDAATSPNCSGNP